MLHYRTFRNTDPPSLARAWNAAFTGRGAVRLRHSAPLEHYVFAKPYFDPAGLIVAEEDGAVVGFAHAGFGPSTDRKRLCTAEGIVCLLGVVPSHRRRGVGTELLRRCEAYLASRGAQAVYAGASVPRNPFYLGLYGGSESPGFLSSDPTAEPFFGRHGYRACETWSVFQLRLNRPLNVLDARFAGLRRGFEVRAQPQTGPIDWWQTAVFGPLELLEFALEDKGKRQVVARAEVWEMDGFSQRWGEAAVALAGVEVQPEARRQGLAKYLLAQTFRYLQDQYFTLVEAHAPAGNDAATALFRSLGFEQVDTGKVYQKMS